MAAKRPCCPSWMALLRAPAAAFEQAAAAAAGQAPTLSETLLQHCKNIHFATNKRDAADIGSTLLFRPPAAAKRASIRRNATITARSIPGFICMDGETSRSGEHKPHRALL